MYILFFFLLRNTNIVISNILKKKSFVILYSVAIRMKGVIIVNGKIELANMSKLNIVCFI